MGDSVSQQILLTGDAAKLCKKISSELSKRKNRNISYSFIISRIISDYISESIDTQTRYLRLYYLTLSVKDAMVWGGGITTTIHLKQPTCKFISEVQKLSREKKNGLNKVEIVNAIVHDYIACVELGGRDFLDYYIEKSLT